MSDKHELIDQLGNVSDNWAVLREILKQIVGPKPTVEEPKKKK